MSDPLRRADINRMTPAELKIHEAIVEVEKLGADERLTDAVVSLSDAQKKVSEFIDDPERKVWL